MKQYQQDLSAVIAAQFGDEVAFLQQLVRTRSANPYTPDNSPADVPVEAEVAAVIQREMARLGLPAELLGASRARPNVLARITGEGRSGLEKTLILTTHMDTVPPVESYSRDPWGAHIEAGRLYGVGVADAKAQIAASVYAASALRRAGIRLAGHLKLAFVVDEESGASSAFGTRYLLEQGLLDGDAAIVGEPGDHKIAIGHRGVYRFAMRTFGEAVHTGLPEWEMGTQGHNAALDMARIILALADCTIPSQPSSTFPGRRAILTFPTLIQGGDAANMVPGSCLAYGDARVLPGTSIAEVRASIERCLADLLPLAYELQDIVTVPAVETPPQAEIVQTLAGAALAVTGKQVRLGGAGPACDGWMFSTRGIPTVCGYGVACGGAHGADEWADLESLRRVTEVYARAILDYLRPVG